MVVLTVSFRVFRRYDRAVVGTRMRFSVSRPSSGLAAVAAIAVGVAIAVVGAVVVVGGGAVVVVVGAGRDVPDATAAKPGVVAGFAAEVERLAVLGTDAVGTVVGVAECDGATVAGFEPIVRQMRRDDDPRAQAESYCVQDQRRWVPSPSWNGMGRCQIKNVI